MQLSDIAAGTHARHPVEIQIGETLVTVDVRPLLYEERAEIARRAREYAKSKGYDAPSELDEVYLIGKSAHMVALGCVDHDSPKDAPRPFFGGGADSVLAHPLITSDHVAYLCECIEHFEDACSPRPMVMNQAEFYARLVKIAGGDQTAFLSQRPALQWSFVRSLAELHLNSLAGKSSTGSSSPDASESSSPN